MYQAQTEETLQGWAAAAAELHLTQNLPLTEAVTQVLRPHARTITAEHARRVCEKTYHVAFDRMYRGMSSSPDRFVHFDGGPPDAGVVTQTLGLHAVAQKADPVAPPTSLLKHTSHHAQPAKTASAFTPAQGERMPRTARTPTYDPLDAVRARHEQVLARQQKIAQAEEAPSPRRIQAENQNVETAFREAASRAQTEGTALEMRTPLLVKAAMDTAVQYMHAGYPAYTLLKIACSLLPQDPPPCLMALAEDYALHLARHGGDLQPLKTAAEAAYPDAHVPDPTHPVITSFQKAADAVYLLEKNQHVQKSINSDWEMLRYAMRKQAGLAEAGVAALKNTGQAAVTATRTLGDAAISAGRRFGAPDTPLRNLGMAGATATLAAREAPGVAAAGHGTYQSLVDPSRVRMAE